MLKRLHKILLTIILFNCLFFVPFAAQCEPLSDNANNSSQMNLVVNEVSVKDLDIDPINTEKVKKSVVPDTKKEGKKVIGLFLKTMIAVLFSAVIVYLILLFVKKFYGTAFYKNEYEEFEGLDLSTPTNKTDALKSFLNRTK